MAMLNLAFFSSKAQIEPVKSIYDIQINSLAGEKIDLETFKGKKILFVNVASECSFTRQYEDLQKLHEKYSEQLIIIGIPCNQFGNQEPGDAKQIETFCSANYGVEFLISEKVNVKGENLHPLYAWLTKQELNGAKSTSVKWNFQKYMVDEDGRFIDFWYSMTSPLSSKIKSKLDN